MPLTARHSAAALASALLLSVLGGCGTGDTVDVVAGAPAAASGLHGLWKLTAPGEPDGTSLQLAGGELSIVRPCVSVDGTWAARGGLFLADRSPHTPPVMHAGCHSAALSEPTWLTDITRYEATAYGWRLIDAEQVTVAELRPGGSLPAGVPTGRAYIIIGDGPEPDPQERARLNALPAAPLPAGAIPLSVEDVIGRWEPELPDGLACDYPYLEFRSGGRWTGHDEGQDHEGRWVLGADGLALGSSSPASAGACSIQEGDRTALESQVSVDAWMLRLARLAMIGEHLVLFDAEGQMLARLLPSSTPMAQDDVDNDGLADSRGDGYVERPQPPPQPKDPRAAGERVPGGVRYLGTVSESQVDLAPEDRFADFEMSWKADQVLGVDGSRKAAKLLTGCVYGEFWLTVHARTSAPAPLAKSMRGWEVGEEEDMMIHQPLFASDLDGDWYEEIFNPTNPGLHRVRVLAKGRARGFDEDVCDTPIESYDVTIWPVDSPKPRERRGDDGL
ncbi:MAG: hypothetical protein ACT4P1_05230 [Sporichthyaceae bacterium]